MTDTHPHHNGDIIPKQFLIGAGALILFSVIVTGVSVAFDVGRFKAETGVVTQARLLVFEDLADGGIAVRDPAAVEPFYVYNADDGGFVRTAMRALAHDRRMHNVGADAPFRLLKTAEGRLIIEDPSTGSKIGAEAFGDDNEQSFALLIDAGA
jgi:putative photosynthetic complex assembly protein